MLTVDGKGVIMRPEQLREATQRAAEKREKNFTARLGRDRRLHAKRMASVAAVYSVDPFVRTPEEILPLLIEEPEEKPTRPRQEGKRVWASLSHTPQEVIAAIFDERCTGIRDKRSTGLPWSTEISRRSTISKRLPRNEISI